MFTCQYLPELFFKTLFQPRQRGRFIHPMCFVDALDGKLVCYGLSCVWVALKKGVAGSSNDAVPMGNQQTFFNDLYASWKRRDELARGATVTLADGLICNMEYQLAKLLKPAEQDQARSEARITADNDRFDAKVLEGIIAGML